MSSTRFLQLVIVLLSIIVNINGQACEYAYQYQSCSTNSECGCLQLSFSSSTGVCGLLSIGCAQFTPCQSQNDTCPQSEYICVRHPNCGPQPLCYPISMLNEQVCPPIVDTTESQIINNIVSNYIGALTSEDGIYNRPGGSPNTHYEAIQLYVPTTGYYEITSTSSMDTHGYLYNGTFYPSNPQLNQIAHNDDGAQGNQFRLPVFLQAGVPYTLVVSTHGANVKGPFSIVATGPDQIYFAPINPPTTTTTTTTTRPPLITSQYSNTLTSSSSAFDRTGNSSAIYYYHAYQVRVNLTGTYTFTSSSSMDTYGYIYQGNFYPAYPTFNIHKQDDDGKGGSQFQLIADLRSDITYILVVTTFSPTTTGSYTINAWGPDNVYLVPMQ